MIDKFYDDRSFMQYDSYTVAFKKKAFEMGCYYFSTKVFKVGSFEALPVKAKILLVSIPRGQTVGYTDNFVFDARIKNGSCDLSIAVRSYDDLAPTFDALGDALQVLPVDYGKSVILMVYADNGATTCREREISTPPWSDIRGNYSKAVEGGIDKLINWGASELDKNGIAIWTGPPGTGKTWGIRSIIREWYSTFNVFNIIDPEILFTNSNYLMSLLYDSPHPNKNNLFIIEDAGQLISVAAKASEGQSFSRLLNVVDGLVGESSKTLFLITSNSEVEKINPALTRNGRCVSSVVFGNLSEMEVSNWFKKNNIYSEEIKPMTISELYAIKNGNKVSIAKNKFGFAA